MLTLRVFGHGDRLRPSGRELEREVFPTSSSRRQIGAPAFGLTSFVKPEEISLFATFCAAPPFSVGGSMRQRSSRWAAALNMTSCVSVSLMDMDGPFASLNGAQPIQAPH